MTDRGRRIGTQRSLEALIRFHRERYPAMEVADVYKLLHQGTMGTQDAVAHPDIAHRRLLVEYGRADARSEAPILEPITLSGQFVRVHLGPAKAQKITPEQISRAAVQSRERMRPDLSAFLGLWLTFREVLAASLGFDLEAVEEFADFAARRGYATQPHSRRYADLYHPSYRLAFLEFLPSSIVG
ncbi:MAG: hypothetical protein KC466_13230 [Myxococcales bacterium]|nr:hypothetical protein [Myxococcales bacterium]